MTGRRRTVPRDRAPLALRLLWGALLCFAGGCNGENESRSSSVLWEEFSGENALKHVQALVDFGPRPPASPALEHAREYITEQLKASGWEVRRQEFTDQTPRGELRFVNLIATFAGAKKPALFLLCSHYDTKIFDDAHFVGANDGGSSSGLLLEMARVLAKEPTLAGKVQLVFFDGEEAYVSF